MAGGKRWLTFDNAIDLVKKIMLDQAQPVERFINLCPEDVRSHISLNLHKISLPVALLITACASGEVRSRSFYAPRKHEPVPPEFWQGVHIDFPWFDFGSEDMQIDEADLRHWFAKRLSRRIGRKPKVDWDGRVKRELFKLLDHHGLPDISDPEWGTQADVEAKVAEICAVPLSESTVREHTSRLISEWQRQKAEN
jgi:hypothetical protein